VTRPYEFVGFPVSAKYDSTTSVLDPVNGLRASVFGRSVPFLWRDGGDLLAVADLRLRLFGFERRRNAVCWRRAA